MSLSGTLSLYPLPDDSGSQRPYFTSGDLTSDKAVIFIGGLWSGLFDTPFLSTLSRALGSAHWRLVQIYWSGIYDGFGSGSLDRDRDELASLVKQLRDQGLKSIVLLGHSTGSQDVIHYLTSPGTRPSVEGGIMQAPASDRQFLDSDESEDNEWKKQLAIAQALIKEGKQDQVLDDAFNKSIGTRMTAYRMNSLVGIGGDDDYFSSDLPDEPDGSAHVHPLSTSFGALPVPVLALWSENDHCRKLAEQKPLLDRWETASKGKLECKIVEGASHQVPEEASQEILSELVVEWLGRHDL